MRKKIKTWYLLFSSKLTFHKMFYLIKPAKLHLKIDLVSHLDDGSSGMVGAKNNF